MGGEVKKVRANSDGTPIPRFPTDKLLLYMGLARNMGHPFVTAFSVRHEHILNNGISQRELSAHGALIDRILFNRDVALSLKPSADITYAKFFEEFTVAVAGVKGGWQLAETFFEYIKVAKVEDIGVALKALSAFSELWIEVNDRGGLPERAHVPVNAIIKENGANTLVTIEADIVIGGIVEKSKTVSPYA